LLCLATLRLPLPEVSPKEGEAGYGTSGCQQTGELEKKRWDGRNRMEYFKVRVV